MLKKIPILGFFFFILISLVDKILFALNLDKVQKEPADLNFKIYGLALRIEGLLPNELTGSLLGCYLIFAEMVDSSLTIG